VHRYQRAQDGRLVAGVAAGLAAHLRVPVLWVRVAFVVTTALSGFGVLVYAALWVLAPAGQVDEPLAPGLAAATRAGSRPRSGRARRAGDPGQLVALCALGIGVVLLVQTTGFGLDAWVFWPLLAVVVGAALVWRTSDEPAAGGHGWLRLLDGSRTAVLVRVLTGAALVAVGLVVFLAGQGELAAAANGLLGTFVVLGGVALLAGPWLWRQSQALAAERRERLLSEQRADVAAHLHDSVLQTLALIQQQSEDPKAVAMLARRQERDLRTWLYAREEPAEQSLRAALQRVASDVEDRHGVPVELVTVGDAPLDDRLRVVVAATGEAVVNAAKHSRASAVDVFAEVDPAQVEVFVRDRGVGFDPSQLPPHRQGVAGSIVGRMQRHGGDAKVSSAPGEGTEVRLTMRRE
jgi:signal transduction histidine kinase/phage shock protein PspC (stress-responsive transcriptional regulator)